MSAPLLVLVHGWGFDATFWDPLRRDLADLETIAFDFGFRGNVRLEPLPSDRRLVAVGHSLGALWLLHRRPFAWDSFIAINGFSRFVEGDGFGPAVPPRTLERMIRAFDRDAAAVTRDFLARCGLDDVPPDLDEEQLAAGLRWLRNWDARVALDSGAGPGLILAARDDAIVPAAMTEACFAGKPGLAVEWRETGGHLLPLTAPGWCAGHIRAFLGRA